MIILFGRLLLACILAFLVGKLVTRLRLPAILGWLLAGMILGPHAFGLLNPTLMETGWYKILLNIFECCMGLMLGSELIIKNLRKSGKQIFITTLTQSLGAFVLVSGAFAIIFALTGLPIYIALIMGGIALATAPAPALSIVKEFKTSGPITKTLIPMAVLDDVLAIAIFFTINTLVTAANTEQSASLVSSLAVMIVLPIIIGAVVGIFAGLLLKQKRTKAPTLTILLSMILLVSLIGLYMNTYVLAEPVLNFMLIGMAFSAVFANMISEERLEEIMGFFAPVLGLSFIVVILNLGAPLDYHLILGAGLYTAIYILARAFGKYTGARIGAKATGLPITVQKYLGFTLLPHSGVSLVFTGVAVASLNTFDPASAVIIQGTIAAAAVINEIIAVILSKKAFEWSGEIGQATHIHE